MQPLTARKILVGACAASLLLGAQAADLPARVSTDHAAVVSGELAKFREVRMPFNKTGLSARELQMIDKLAKASGYLEEIYWQQSDPQGLKLYRELKGKDVAEAKNLRRFLRINGSRFNLIDDQKPFVGTEPMPPGRNLYPRDLTLKALEQYVAAHPDQKAAIYDERTVVQRNGSLLRAVPYHVAYAKWLQPMAKLLREAADLSDDAAFAKYLRLRADALLTDDYFKSDLAWLDLENPKIDLIFAPYETYLDDLLGVKTSYGAAILVRNESESRKLDVYQKYVADIQDALPLPAADRPSKKGLRSPMEVMDAPLRAGDLRHGYQAVADNLPNDPRVHELRGSKKIFFKNFMDARVEHVILPIGHRLLDEKQAAQASAEGYLATTLMHEMAHGLGPAYANVKGQKQDIRAAIGAGFSGLEEAKADIVGLFGLKWLVDHGVVPREKLNGYYLSNVAGIFRTVRFGVAEAHGKAEMMEFNYFVDKKVIRRDNSNGRYVVELERMPAAVADLAKELLEQEATGDRARTEAWFKRYGTMPTDLAQALAKAGDVPVDIDPVSDFAEDQP